MTEPVTWIPDNVWADIVAHAPVASVDLVVDCADGVMLARRQNEPAKGEWFVPGGRVQKGEPIRETVYRVAREELGIDVTIETELGAYDHFYESADVADAGGKHYVAHGYHVTPDSEAVELDDQHDESAVFPVGELPDLHPYVRAYLDDANLLNE
ncbi:NUDIX domain-containing protein [Haloarcula argentinensis]|uniref:NUDIX domain-containing protein n=1 Tax=Haloarcula argentinensis TaxID=43776 RepID=A0A847UH09_HALAR|nr:NUDIX domain-containing protein [Haloarcula argentinensis]NLV12639.1 NUDIX domain-containing protein [Haloarcula argentinensis]